MTFSATPQGLHESTLNRTFNRFSSAPAYDPTQPTQGRLCKVIYVWDNNSPTYLEIHKEVHHRCLVRALFSFNNHVSWWFMSCLLALPCLLLALHSALGKAPWEHNTCALKAHAHKNNMLCRRMLLWGSCVENHSNLIQ